MCPCCSIILQTDLKKDFHLSWPTIKDLLHCLEGTQTMNVRRHMRFLFLRTGWLVAHSAMWYIWHSPHHMLLHGSSGQQGHPWNIQEVHSFSPFEKAGGNWGWVSAAVWFTSFRSMAGRIDGGPCPHYSILNVLCASLAVYMMLTSSGAVQFMCTSCTHFQTGAL